MEVVRARHFAHSKWACFYAQNSSWAGLGTFGPPFGVVNWRILAVNWRILAVNWRILAVNWRICGGPTPTRPGYISLVHLTGGWYIYIFPTIVVLAALSPTPTALPPGALPSPEGPRQLASPPPGRRNPQPKPANWRVFHHVRPSASAAAACRGSDTLRRPPLGPMPPARPRPAMPSCPVPPAPAPHLPPANWRASPPGALAGRPPVPPPPAPPEEGRPAGAGPESGWGARTPSRRRRGGSTGHRG